MSQPNIQQVRTVAGQPATNTQPTQNSEQSTNGVQSNTDAYTKVRLEDLEMELDDLGNLIFVDPSTKQVQSSNEGSNSPNAFADNNNQPMPKEPSFDSSNKSDTKSGIEPNLFNDFISESKSKFEKLEGAVFQIASFLNEKENKSMPTNSQTEQPNIEIDFQSETWPNQLQQMIKSVVTSAIDERLKPIDNDFKSIKVRNEFQDAASKYGQDFLELAPEMIEIKRSDPNISWDVLYNSFSKVKSKLVSKQDSTTRSEVVVNNGKAMSPQSLQERANKLNTGQTNGMSSSSLIEKRKTVNSMDDAINLAFEELYGVR